MKINRKKIMKIIWITLIIMVGVTMILGSVGPGLFQ